MLSLGLGVTSSLTSVDALVRGLYSAGGVLPRVALDFDDNNYVLDSGPASFNKAFMGTSPKLTYATTSNSTMVDSSGNLVWAPHNLIRHSEDFSGSTWTSSKLVNPSQQSTTVLAPDGSGYSYYIEEDNTSGIHYIADKFGPLLNATWTASVYIKQKDAGVYVQLRPFGVGTGLAFATFSPADGTLYESGGTELVSAVDGVAVGDGWFKVTMTCSTSLLNSNDGLEITMTNGSAGERPSYLGSGNGVYLWGAHVYRSDLGGMVPVPGAATGFETYVPTNGNKEYLPRVGHHVYNGSTWVNEGLLIESEPRTNLLTNSEDFSESPWSENFSGFTMNAVGPDGASNSAGTLTDDESGGAGSAYMQVPVTVSTETTYTFSIFAKADQLSDIQLRCVEFTTPGSVGVFFDLSAGEVGNTSGSGATGEIEDFGRGWYRCSITFTTDVTDIYGKIRVHLANGESLSVSRDGTSSVLFYGAQFEEGSTLSSYIPTNGSQQIRGGQSLTVPPAEFGWNTDAVSIQMDGRMTYADTDVVTEAVPWDWFLGGTNRIFTRLNTAGGTGKMSWIQGSAYEETGESQFSPGINVPFNIASRHGSTFIDGAVDGVAQTANTTPTALPDLSNTNLQIAQDFMGTIGQFRQFAGDVGDAGLVTATNPSTEPTLSLTFDGTGGSFYNLSWSE